MYAIIENMQWDEATNIILIAALMVLAVFAGLGLYQWISRKSIKKVDKRLLFVPVPLVIMAIVYIIFDKFFILNLRPDGSGEPSFPSTHVMVVSTIFFLTIINLKSYVHSKLIRVILIILMLGLIVLVCVGRVLANKHWPSDVLGGLAFAFIFAEIYYYLVRKWS